MRKHRTAYVVVALSLAVVGLIAWGVYQRSQVERIDRNSRRIDAVVERIDVAIAHGQQRTFDGCVRQAILRAHVNRSTTAIRSLLKLSAAERAKLKPKQKRQLRALLRGFTIAPGPTTRAECLRIAPPPRSVAP